MADLTAIAERLKKQRKRSLKRFLKRAEPQRFTEVTADARAVVKNWAESEPMTESLAELLKQSWQKWNAAIDVFDSDPKISRLHAVRIKAKSLRYALDLRQEFYPHAALKRTSSWVKSLQDQIGDWHDELH